MNLKLRYFKTEDAKRVASLVGDKTVSQWTSNIPYPYSEQDAIDWINHTANNTQRQPFAVEVDRVLVACVSYWPHQPSGVEVGYWVGKAFWGKGIATSALQMMLDSEDFPKDKDVYAKVIDKNIGSQRVLEKCGFAFLKDICIVKNKQGFPAKYFILSCENHH